MPKPVDPQLPTQADCWNDALNVMARHLVAQQERARRLPPLAPDEVLGEVQTHDH
jgi:hypothetical protein